LEIYTTWLPGISIVSLATSAQLFIWRQADAVTGAPAPALPGLA
jgi:hypothetical protein